MPVCSYLVSPVSEQSAAFREAMDEMPECEVERAENRSLYILLTETEDFEHQKELEERLKDVESIDWLMQTFGEIAPDSQEDPIEK